MKRVIYRKRLFFIFVVIEIAFIVGNCFWSKHGIYAISLLREENRKLQMMMSSLENDIEQTVVTINLLENNAFYKEKIARLELDMVRVATTNRTEDEIYYMVD